MKRTKKKPNKKNICTRHAVHCSTVTTIHYLGGRREGTHAAVFHTTTGESPRPKCLQYFQNIPWVPCVCTRIAALETRNFKCTACMSAMCVYVRAPSSVELSGWEDGEELFVYLQSWSWKPASLVYPDSSCSQRSISIKQHGWHNWQVSPLPPHFSSGGHECWWSCRCVKAK